MTRPTLLLVFGGKNSEHGVSCLTAASVLGAINHERYRVVPVGITPEGRWTMVPTAKAAAMVSAEGRLPQVDGTDPEVALLAGGRLVRVGAGVGEEPGPATPVEVVLTLLHGPYGEDGTIQGQLEMVGVRYVGSGVAASAIGMDKALMKSTLAHHGIPQGQWRLISPEDWLARRDQALAGLNDLQTPLFVKPARAGSSVGISRVEDREDLPAAVEAAREYDPRVVVEEGILGAREIECAVLGGRAGQPPRASLVGEIRMLTEGFYDFDAKYLPGGQVALDIPAIIDDDLQARVQQVAIQTFEAIGAEGLARVDTFITEAGEVLVNEINTMPGFTEYSMYPALWQASGLDYGNLIDELIELALARRLGLR